MSQLSLYVHEFCATIDLCDHGIAFTNAILVGDYDAASSNI